MRGTDRIDDISTHLEINKVKIRIDEVFKNLQFFDDWSKHSRYIFYYEDLIASPKEEIEKLLSFLEEDTKDLDLFIDNIDFHKKKCLSYYDKRFGTLSKGSSTTFYSEQYSDTIIKTIIQNLKNKYPLLWKKYLTRYDSIP